MMAAALEIRVAEFSCPVDRSQIGPASNWLNQTGEFLGIPNVALGKLEVCLNEAMANVLSHGGEGAKASPFLANLTVEPLNDTLAAASLRVCDGGVRFDATTFAAPPVAKTLEDAQPGGLGIVMIRRCADTLSYSYADGKNQLTMSVHWPLSKIGR